MPVILPFFNFELEAAILMRLNYTLQNETEGWTAQAPFACPPDTACGVDSIGPNYG